MAADSRPPPPKRTAKILLVGPTYPFRGGISHYTTLLARHLRPRYELRFITFHRQYPGWLYPGASDRDPTTQAALHEPAEALLDGANPLTWLRVAHALRRWQPDALLLQWSVSYWGPLLWLLARAAPAETRVAILCHNATPHETSRLAPLARWLQRQVMRQADALLCHAASDAATLRALVPEVPVTTAMLPTYQALAGAAGRGAEARAPGGGPQLLFFGLVRPYKGVETLLAALPAVLRDCPEAHLTIAGEWWKAAGDPHMLVPEPLRPHVTILDRYLPNEALPALFAQADVVVLPYRSATQSAVVQLAFGFGLPVITTTVGGLPEAVEQERSGLLVPPDDPAALAAAIVRFQREGWRERLAPGVAAARQRFSWAALVAALEAALWPDG